MLIRKIGTSVRGPGRDLVNLGANRVRIFSRLLTFQIGVRSLRTNERGRQLRRPYALSSVQRCSPHWHLNMRTVRPFRGLSMVRSSAGFSPQWLHVRTGLGSKLEKTSFLNSLAMSQSPAVRGEPVSHKGNIRSEKIFQPRAFAWNDLLTRIQDRPPRRPRIQQGGVALADFRFEAHYGLKSDIALSPKSARERTRSRGRGWRRGQAITSAAVTI
jgi:hypothetical protein